MVIIFNLIRIVGILLFMYVFWKNLKDDYPSNDVIWLGWLIVAIFYLGSRLMFFGVNKDLFLFWSKPGFSYFGGYLCVLATIALYVKRKSWKMILILEDGVKAFLLFLAFNYFEELFRSKLNGEVMVKILIIFLGYYLTGVFKDKYRSFVWFKSGRKGFVFWSISALVLGLFMINNIVFRNSLILSYLYGLSCLISVTGLFMLGDVWKKK